MISLVRKMGVDYFMERYRNLAFMYEDTPMVVSGVDDSVSSHVAVMAKPLVPSTERSSCVGNAVPISETYFKTVRAFRHPDHGYRRVGNQYAAWVGPARSYNPGISVGNIQRQFTPMSAVIYGVDSSSRDDYADSEHLYRDYRLLLEFMKPTFDSKEDVLKMIEGDKSCVVLSPSLVIEPSVTNRREAYSVLFMGRTLGYVDRDMRPLKNLRQPNHLIEKVVSNALA